MIVEILPKGEGDQCLFDPYLDHRNNRRVSGTLFPHTRSTDTPLVENSDEQPFLSWRTIPQTILNSKCLRFFRDFWKNQNFEMSIENVI